MKENREKFTFRKWFKNWMKLVENHIWKRYTKQVNLNLPKLKKVSKASSNHQSKITKT